MTQTRTLGERFRFSPTDLNALMKALVIAEKEKGALTFEHHLEVDTTQSSSGQVLTYYEIYKNFVINNTCQNKKFLLFNVLKDSATRENEPTLPYIGDVIKKILDKTNQDEILLIPTRQCRGYFKLPIASKFKWLQSLLHHFINMIKKRHMVLTEIDLGKKTVTVHDPQPSFDAWFRRLGIHFNLEIYPDKLEVLLNELKEENCNFGYKKFFYGQQTDNIVCGPYTHRYLLSYLENGCALDFSKLKVLMGGSTVHALADAYTTYLGSDDKQTYLKRYLPNWNGISIEGEDEDWGFEHIEAMDSDTFDDLFQLLEEQIQQRDSIVGVNLPDNHAANPLPGVSELAQQLFFSRQTPLTKNIESTSKVERQASLKH